MATTYHQRLSSPNIAHVYLDDRQITNYKLQSHSFIYIYIYTHTHTNTRKNAPLHIQREQRLYVICERACVRACLRMCHDMLRHRRTSRSTSPRIPQVRREVVGYGSRDTAPPIPFSIVRPFHFKWGRIHLQ